MDAKDPETLYAAFWQAWRTPWQLVSGGAGSGIFKTTDGGEHWTEITRNPGLPQGVIGNIGLAVSPVNPSHVWAIVEADSGGVFRSADGGATWTRTNSDRRLRQRAWYYTRIFADTKDENSVYVLNTGMYRSTDNGKTFRNIQVPHGDNHDLWIAPNDAQRMIESNDGGANVSFNGGKSWSEQDQATAQFYHVVTTNHFPYRVCGAQQDNSTLCGPSRKSGGIDISDWYDVGGGESGYIAVRPDSPDVVFAGSYGGLLTHKDIKTGFERDVNPWPNNPMGHDAADAKYRFQWTFPIVISPHNPNRMYVGSSVIFQSDDEGQTYKAISPDLTRHDPRTLGSSGGPITKDQTSVEYYATVFTIAESPRTAGVIWAGTDDGLVQVTRDGGKTWKNVTPAGLPEWARISMIDASNFAPGTAYLAANRYQLDDMKPYLYRTNDYGATWTPITNGIPATEFTRVVREDPERAGLLYAGTERGVWVSFDDGAKLADAQAQSADRACPRSRDQGRRSHRRNSRALLLDTRRSFRIEADASGDYACSRVSLQAAQRLPRGIRRRWRHWCRGRTSIGRKSAVGRSCVLLARAASSARDDGFSRSAGKVIRSFTSQQDPTVAADSVRGDSIRTARNDSIRRAGGTPDTTTRSEARGEETPPGDDGPPRRPPPPRVANKAGLNTFAWNLRYPGRLGVREHDPLGGRHLGPGGSSRHLHRAHDSEWPELPAAAHGRERSTQRGERRRSARAVRFPDAYSREDDPGERRREDDSQREGAARRSYPEDAAGQERGVCGRHQVAHRPALGDRERDLSGEEPIRSGPAQLSDQT